LSSTFIVFDWIASQFLVGIEAKTNCRMLRERSPENLFKRVSPIQRYKKAAIAIFE